MHDFVKLCLATGACLLATAAVGGWVNRYYSLWFDATGVAVVGLFHLVLAAFNWPACGLNERDCGERPCDVEPSREDQE